MCKSKVVIVLTFTVLTTATTYSLILNPDFESYTMGTTATGMYRKMPNNWQMRNQGNVNGFSDEYSENERGGALALSLYCQRNHTHKVGDYLEFYQTVDLTGVDKIVFDVDFSGTSLFSRSYVAIDSQKLWTHSGTGLMTEVRLDQFIDTSAFSGQHNLVLGLEVLTAFDQYTYEWADGNIYFDNFRAIPEPASLCLLALGGLMLRKRKVPDRN